MNLDRFTRIVLSVIAVALVVIALHPWLPTRPWPTVLEPAVAEAQSGPQYEVAVPRAWGKVIAYGSGNLLLQAEDGTIREVDIRGKAPEYPRIKVLVRWN